MAMCGVLLHQTLPRPWASHPLSWARDKHVYALPPTPLARDRVATKLLDVQNNDLRRHMQGEVPVCTYELPVTLTLNRYSPAKKLKRPPPYKSATLFATNEFLRVMLVVASLIAPPKDFA